MSKNTTVIGIAVAAVLCLPLAQDTPAQQVRGKTVIRDGGHDLSAPLRDMVRMTQGRTEEFEEEPPPRPTEPPPPAPGVPDPIVQSSPGPVLGTIDLMNFDGIPRTGSAPPDTNGAIGATQYMQWANSRLAVYDKATGDLLLGPVSGSTLFADMGAPCETNHGDGIILFDKIDGLWMFSELVNSSSGPIDPASVCIAVSTSSDATGTYNRYLFGLSSILPAGTTLSDYPKFGVWPDGYYYTANIFGSTPGTNICAFDRVSMIAGNDATAQCFFSRTIGGSYLPADFDGTTLPPDGSPNFLADLNGNSALRLVSFHVDWANTDNSTLSTPVVIPVAPFTRPSGGAPQLGSPQGLDTIGDRLMFRLAYRNFGDHESLVLNHTVAANGSIGIRWYELQSPNDAPFVNQEGTFMPDGVSRWMGSVAMDQAGDMAVGYSASSSDIHPAIRYTGRTPDDPLGTLEDEKSIIDGSGSQGVSSRSRWGDYSAITIDPVDDCTFWYTTMYMQTDGSLFGWNTRIASFQFPSCGGALSTK